MAPAPPSNLPIWHPAFWISTWFGSGLLPIAPGTWGSLFALPFAWAIQAYAGPWALAAAALLAFLAGCWASSIYAQRSRMSDPGPVVIDEVAGQWLTLAAIPADIGLYVLGFLLFRMADIFKPWPANLADRQVKGGLGIMLDDIIAAIYAGAVLYLVSRWVM